MYVEAKGGFIEVITTATCRSRDAGHRVLSSWLGLWTQPRRHSSDGIYRRRRMLNGESIKIVFF
jgi:hypothetical protein